MKNILRLVALVALMVTATGAFADNNPLITVDETGHGSLLFPGGSPIPTTGTLQADPGPGGLSSVLTYNLLGPPSLLAGDLKLFDPNTTFSDVVRFNPAGTGGNPAYPASLVFYSDPLDGIDSLADTTSPPSSFYTNVISLTEVDIGGVEQVFYTPNDAQPGFVAGFSVTYHIISDTPEPSSVILLGSGLMGVLGMARRRSRK